MLEITGIRVKQRWTRMEEGGDILPCGYVLQFRRLYSDWEDVPVIEEQVPSPQPQVELATILSTVS